MARLGRRLIGKAGGSLPPIDDISGSEPHDPDEPAQQWGDLPSSYGGLVSGGLASRTMCIGAALG